MVWIGDLFFEPADASVSSLRYTVLPEAPDNVADSAAAHTKKPRWATRGRTSAVAATHTAAVKGVVHTTKPHSPTRSRSSAVAAKHKAAGKGVVHTTKPDSATRSRPSAVAAKHTTAGKVVGSATVHADRAYSPRGRSSALGEKRHMDAPDTAAEGPHTAARERSSILAGKRKVVDAEGTRLPSSKQMPPMTSNKVVPETSTPLPLDKRYASAPKERVSTNSVAAAESAAAVSSTDSMPVTTEVSTDKLGAAEPAAAVSSFDVVPVATKGDADDRVAVNQTQESYKDSLVGWGTLGRRRAIANLVLLLAFIGVCALPPIYWATLAKHADKAVQTDPLDCS